MTNGDLELYDFDHTIYRGDASFDFYKFAVVRQPSLLRFLPYQLFHLLLFLVRVEDRSVAKSHLFVFVKAIKQLDVAVTVFWEKHEHKMADWYKQQPNRASHVIVSASPSFLLDTIAATLGVSYVIATKIDVAKGRIDGLNCHGAQKPVRIHEALPDASFSAAYSDHLSDMPMLRMAKKAYLVYNHKLTPLEQLEKLQKSD